MIFTRFIPRATQGAYRWDARAAWLFGLYAGMTAPFFLVIAKRMGATDHELELLVASTAIGSLITLVITTFMQNRPKKPFVIAVGMISRGMLVLMAFITMREAFVWLVVISQIVSVWSGPAYASVIMHAYPEHARGQTMGVVRIGMTLTMMVASLYVGRLLDTGQAHHGAAGLPLVWVLALAIGVALVLAHELRGWPARLAVLVGVPALAWFAAPALAHKVGYQVVFPVAALLGVASTWMFSHLPEPYNPARHEEPTVSFWQSMALPVVDWRFGLYCFAFLFFGFGNWLRAPLVPILMVDELNVSYEVIGQLAMVGSGVGIIGYVLWGKLLDRFSPFFILLTAFLIQGVVAVLQAEAYGVTLLMAAAIIQGLINPAIELGAFNSIARFTSGEGIPRYMAMHSFLVGIRGVIAPVLGTSVFLNLFTLRQCFYVSGIIIWAGFALMLPIVFFILLPYQQRRKAAAQRSIPA